MCKCAGNAACLGGVCTACGRPGEPCCTGDRRIRGSDQGVEGASEDEDLVCWSKAKCSAVQPPLTTVLVLDIDAQLA